ncbi:MAG: M20/M25/M40 family metallo-hydrolase [Candidatus Angelobacter sp.]
MTVPIRLALTAAFFLAAVPNSSALFQAPPTDTLSAYIVEDLRELVETPAVSGYEQVVGKKIVAQLKGFTQQNQPHKYKVTTDNLGNVTVTIGSGAPRRLMVAPMDEPGFVVSGITPEGYLTLQRLPQGGNLPLFNELYAAQPVKLETPKGEWISGAIAGVSIHLQPQRQHPPSMADLDNMYVDVGATSAEQARSGGADVLSPVAIDRTFCALNAGRKYASPAIGDRFGAVALLELLRTLDPAKLKGTLTVAFVTQQWLGARGLQKVVYQLNPDEMVYVGRLIRPPSPATGNALREAAPAFKQAPGSGVLIAQEQDAKPDAEPSSFAAELKQMAGKMNVAVGTDVSAPLLPRGGYMAQAKLPERTVHLAIATAWPSTPAEVIDAHDLLALTQLLQMYAQGSIAQPARFKYSAKLPEHPAKPETAPPPETILKQLIETYGVSGGHEAAMRQSVTRLLPAWAKPETDDAGNLVLHWASAAGGTSSAKPPSIAVVAHMDEIGYEVHAILPDGRLELETKGGGVLAYFLGHAGLVHSANGEQHSGVLELPEGWDRPDFQWSRNPRQTFYMDIGARNAEDVAALHIKTGDFVTIPKQYRQLMGRRASARAFDDRVGCTALVAAAWALGPDLKGRDVTFTWSTSEELGLEGAAAAARRLSTQGKTPDYVFAVDTFVSADSPLESKRFGDAPIGQGFVVRAIDNSNVVPRELAARVVSMARTGGIPVQYGVTGGGNDGAAFLLYGATDIALGWPLRYSHSPAEVIDLRDVEALGNIITAVAQGW